MKRKVREKMMWKGKKAKKCFDSTSQAKREAREKFFRAEEVSRSGEVKCTREKKWSKTIPCRFFRFFLLRNELLVEAKQNMKAESFTSQ